MSNYGDQFMLCPECGGRAESDAVDVGVGLYIAGNFSCECGWEYEADGMARVGSYDDWFMEPIPKRPIEAGTNENLMDGSFSHSAISDHLTQTDPSLHP